MAPNGAPLTPIEEVLQLSDRGPTLTDFIDMLLSRGAYDPRNDPRLRRDVEEAVRPRQEAAQEAMAEAREARLHAIRLVQRTNDISDTLRRLRA